ncbi:MAG: hypothetical protein JWN28_189 [Candidatus Saccharibacteria bacterium]|nr:hypothetical protein [Candidatus Saccharibacteria bacterium]
MKSVTQLSTTNPNRNVRETNYHTAQKLSIFLGLLGVDRFYIGDIWLGILKLLLTISLQGIPFSLVLWIIDIFVIKRHANDWDDWLDSKQSKRADKKLQKETSKEAAIEARKVVEERKANGQCIKCGSDKLQAASDTYSKTTLGPSGHTTMGQIFSTAPGTLPTREKTKTRIMLVCLNCGFKRQV